MILIRILTADQGSNFAAGPLDEFTILLFSETTSIYPQAIPLAVPPLSLSSTLWTKASDGDDIAAGTYSG